MRVLSLWGLVGAWLGGCAATAPSLSDDRPGPAAGEGVVIGKFGVPPSRMVGAVGRDLLVQRMSDGRRWKIPFLEGESTDGRRSAPFLAVLPAGSYGIVSWSVRFLDTEEYQEEDERPTLTFEVAAGEVSCVGALYLMKLSGHRRSYAPELRDFAALVLARDECAALEGLLRQRASGLRLPMRVALAGPERSEGNPAITTTDS